MGFITNVLTVIVLVSGAVMWGLRKSNKKLALKAGLVFIAGILLIGAIGSSDEDEDIATSIEAQNESLVVENSIRDEKIREEREQAEKEKEESRSIEESIRQAEKEAQGAEREAKRQADPIGFEAQEAWGSNLDSVSVNSETGSIEVHAQMSDNFSSSWIVSGFEGRILEFLEAIENENFGSVSIMGHFNMVDDYGNADNMNVYELRLSKDAISQINFDYFLQDNLSKVADFYYLHNAFK